MSDHLDAGQITSGRISRGDAVRVWPSGRQAVADVRRALEEVRR